MPTTKTKTKTKSIILLMKKTKRGSLEGRLSKIDVKLLNWPIAAARIVLAKIRLIGNSFLERIEDQADRAVIRQTDFSKGEDFEEVMDGLNG